jgi:hypothetical protein
MSFVNERISPEDVKTYRLEEIDQHYRGTASRVWCIDRDRDTYLRMVQASGREQTNGFVWTLWWKGQLIEVRTRLLRTKRSPDGRSEIEQHERVEEMKIPPVIFAEAEAVRQLYREARTVYREAGVRSTSSVYSLTLEF